VVLLICLVGTYSVNASRFELGLLLAFGIVGYLFRKIGADFSPCILALILGPSLEQTFRQALMRSGGSFAIFVTSPIALTMLVLSLLLLLWNIWRSMRPEKAAWEKALASEE